MINFDPLTKERQDLVFLLQYRAKNEYKNQIPEYDVGYFRISKHFKSELNKAIDFFKEEIAKGEQFLFPEYTIQVPSVNLIKLKDVSMIEEINLEKENPVILSNLGEELDNFSEGVSAKIKYRMGNNFNYVSGYLKDSPLISFRSPMFPIEILVESPFPNTNKKFIYW